MEKLTARFTVKTLLVITLVVAAYFAGRSAKVDKLETENEELRPKVRELEKKNREYLETISGMADDYDELRESVYNIKWNQGY